MITVSQAISIINNRRGNAELAVSKTEDALRTDDFYLETENALGALILEKSKREAYNEDLGDLNCKISVLNSKLVERMRELGYPENLLVPDYFCKRCNDEGFTGGKACSCLRQLISESAQKEFGRLVTDIDSFSAADTSIYGKDSSVYKMLFQKIQKYVDDFPYKKPYAVFAGKTGNGKSFTASVLCNAVMKKGYTAIFINAVQLNELFLKRHLTPVEEKETVLAPFTEADLLVIDDLGSENVYKNVTAPYLYLLLLQRIDKNTVITTNITAPEELESRYESRTASRLTDTANSLFIMLEGEDIRKSARKR